MYIYVSEAMLEKSISKNLTKEQKDNMTLGQLEHLSKGVEKFVANRDAWLDYLVAKAIEKASEPTVQMEETEEVKVEEEVKPKRGKKGQKVLAEILD